MRAIYRPRARAAEYSPLAINLYTGCDHGCLYCYGPRCLRMTFEAYMHPEPRRGLCRQIERDLRHVDSAEQILLSFIGDPYCQLEERMGYTRDALERLLPARNPVAILTKGGGRCLRDLDLFRVFGPRIKVGATLTCVTAEASRHWEPHAAPPGDRIYTLRLLHNAGIRTWVSMEPVLSPSHSLELLRLIPFVDEIRLGKLNNYGDWDTRMDWASYLREALQIAGPKAVVKKDLAEAAGMRTGVEVAATAD